MVIFHQSYWTQVLLTILRYEVPNILKYLENQVKQMHEMEVQHDEWQLKGLSEDSSVFLSHHLDSCIKSCRRAHLFPLSYEIGENNRSLISAPLWRMRYWWVGYRPKWVTSWVPETVDVCVIPIILYLFFFFLIYSTSKYAYSAGRAAHQQHIYTKDSETIISNKEYVWTYLLHHL